MITESTTNSRAAIRECVAARRDNTTGIATAAKVEESALLTILLVEKKSPSRYSSTEKSTRRATEASSHRIAEAGSKHISSVEMPRHCPVGNSRAQGGRNQ
jgi:hypothetical protein